MKVLVVLLVCGVIVHGDARGSTLEENAKELLSDLPNVIGKGRQTIKEPTEGLQNCAGLTSAEYLNCCAPQETCMAGTSISEQSVPEVTCGALKKTLLKLESSNLNQVLRAVTKQSSECLKEAAADSFQEVNGPSSDWTELTFQFLPTEALSGLNTSSLKKINPELFKDSKSLAKIGLSLQDMEEEQVSSIVPGLKTAFGGLKTWTTGTLDKVLTAAPRALCGLSTTDVEALPENSITGSIKSVSSAISACEQEHSAPVRKTILKKFKQISGEVSQWSASTLNSLEGLKASIPSTDFASMRMEVLTDSATLSATDNVLSPKQKLAIADAVSDYAVARGEVNLPAAVLQDIPSALPLLRRSDIKALDCKSVGTHFLQSGQHNIPKQSLQNVVQRVKDCGLGNVANTSGAASVDQLTTADVQSFTPFLGGFSSSDIHNMTLKAALGNSSLPDGLSPVQQKVIISKLVSGTRAKRAASTTDTPPLTLDLLPPQLGESLSVVDIATLTPTLSDIAKATARGLSVAKEVAAEFADIALKALGSDLSDVAKYPSNTIFKQLGKNVVKGFNRTTLSKVPLDSLDGFVSSASEFDLSAGQMDTMVKRFTETSASAFSESDVRGLGPMVTQMAVSVVDRMPEGARAQVARNIGQSKRVLGLAGDNDAVKKLTEKAVAWLKVDKRALTCANVRSLGLLSHTLEANTLSTLNKNEMAACVSLLSASQAGEEIGESTQRLRKVATTVHTALKDASSGLDADVVQALGSAACHLPDSYFASLTTAAKFNQVFEPLGNAPCAASSTAAKTVVSMAKEHHTAGSSQASNLPRQALRTINKALPAMSDADITGISRQSILNSLETFGLASFSTAQSKQLVQKIAPGAGRARRAATEETLSTADVKSLGRLACSFSPSHLKQFLADVDVIESLSKPDCYTAAAKKELIAAVKEPSAQGRPEGWSDVVLSSLGEWTSGLEAADIAAIPNPAFRSAVKSLGSKKNMPATTVQALAKKATETFTAAVESWTEGTIASLGVIVGSVGIDSQGCTRGVVEKFTSDQIGAIAPENVPAMHNLRCMATSQIQSMDGEQVRAITPRQTASLASSQQQAVTQLSCYPNCATFGSAPGSGAAGLSVTATLVAAAILAAWAF